MSTPEAPQLEPVRNDGIRAIQVGLGLWVLAGLVLVVQRDELADKGTQWWLAVCGAGLLIGIVALGILVRRRSLMRARERDAGATGAGSTG
jgi:ABC-type nickel/cobalt efflux system permease component RcnA